MSLATIRPGAYTMTYDGSAVGMATSRGRSLRYRMREKPINDTDTYGLTQIEAIAMGCDCFLSLTFKEWNAGVRKAIWPASTTFDGTLGILGRLVTDSLAKAIVLTAVTGTPAATVGPATYTFSKACLAAENDVEIINGPEETDVPVLFRIYPYDTGGGTIGFFTLT